MSDGVDSVVGRGDDEEAQSGDYADKVARVLDELTQFARTAGRIAALGSAAFFDADDDIVRRAGRSVVIDVSSAVGRLPPSFRVQFPDVPWRNIRDTRNYIAHQYDAVRDDLIWETLTLHLPALVTRLTGRPDITGEGSS